MQNIGVLRAPHLLEHRYRLRCKSMCLSIDILESEEEVFNIRYTSELSSEVLDFGVEGFG